MLTVLVEARGVGTGLVGVEEGLRGWICRQCARAGADGAPILGSGINTLSSVCHVGASCCSVSSLAQPTQGEQGGAGITALGPATRLGRVPPVQWRHLHPKPGRVAAIHRVDGLHLCFTEPVVPSLGTESNVGRDVAGVAAAGDDGDALLQRPL